MADLAETGSSIYHRRRRRRATITLTVVTSMLVGTLVYAARYVQGWDGAGAGTPVVGACHKVTSKKLLRPSGVTVNVYNTTAHAGLAATVAHTLRRQRFKVVLVANDPLGLSIQGVGQIRHGPTGTNGATLAATRLPGSTDILDDRTDASVDIVLGNAFTTHRAMPSSPHAIVVRYTTTC